MILLIRRRVLIGLMVTAAGFAIAMAILGYLTVVSTGELSAPERKTAAERVLLVGIVGTSLVVAGAVGAVYRVASLNNLLRRLTEMHRLSDDQLRIMLRRFGAVGDQIGGLYDNINDLSARKSTRIAAMNALLAAILARSDRKLLVVNAGGKVYKATRAALDLLELSPAEANDKPIDDIMEVPPFAEIAAAMARSAGSYAITSQDKPVAVIRVMGDQGLAAYYLFLLDSDAREELERNPPQSPATAAEKVPDTARPGEPRSAIKTFLNYVAGKRR